jgi:hypothetical protein
MCAHPLRHTLSYDTHSAALLNHVLCVHPFFCGGKKKRSEMMERARGNGMEASLIPQLPQPPNSISSAEAGGGRGAGLPGGEWGKWSGKGLGFKGGEGGGRAGGGADMSPLEALSCAAPLPFAFDANLSLGPGLELHHLVQHVCRLTPPPHTHTCPPPPHTCVCVCVTATP